MVPTLEEGLTKTRCRSKQPLIIGVGVGLLLFTGLSYMIDSGLGALISTILFGLPGALCVLYGLGAILVLYPAVSSEARPSSQRSQGACGAWHRT
jgi:hypothetical protein